MGMALRKTPLMDYHSQMGANTFYKFGASTATGWRECQEDRVLCLPEYYKDFSLFAVFDGHGAFPSVGFEVAEYLFQNYADHLTTFLDSNDIELALQLSFLSCDSSLRIISDAKEIPPEKEIEDGVIKDLPICEAVIPALQAILNNTDSAGTSQEGAESLPEGLRKTIACETLKFLTSADLEPENSDDDDANYDECMDTSTEETDSNQSEDRKSGSDGSSDDDEPPKRRFLDSRFDSCGSTGTVVLLNQERAYIANVGDSRCIAAVNGVAVELSVDHKPTDQEEHARIIGAGSRVLHGRIKGGLNMSRAFGDFEHKKEDDMEQALICDPYITSIEVNKDLDFIVIASDGIWNSLGNQEVIDYINIRIKYTNLSDICEELFKFILSPDTSGDGTGCDNMSMTIIEFNKKNKVVKNFHICYNDMNLDENFDEMEAHCSYKYNDESAGMEIEDGNIENKNEKPGKSSEDSIEKDENKEFSAHVDMEMLGENEKSGKSSEDSIEKDENKDMEMLGENEKSGKSSEDSIEKDENKDMEMLDENEKSGKSSEDSIEKHENKDFSTHVEMLDENTGKSSEDSIEKDENKDAHGNNVVEEEKSVVL